MKAGQRAGYPRFKGPARFDSVEWSKDGDGARWHAERNRVYLQGIGHVKVTAHREVEGRVKTIQIKRQGRRWVLVLSCDDVPTNPLPATGKQAGVDVGIAVFATLSDGTAVENPRWARTAAAKLRAGQQRLQRAKRGSNNCTARRESVGARHRKIANRRKDFHHKQARQIAAGYDLIVVEHLRIANMLRRAKPARTPTTMGSSCPIVRGRNPGSIVRSVMLAGASSSRYCAPKRKTLGVSGSRSTHGTLPTSVSAALTQRARIASLKRTSPANAAVTQHRQTNTPHATSLGLDWPSTPHPLRKRSWRPPAVRESPLLLRRPHVDRVIQSCPQVLSDIRAPRSPAQAVLGEWSRVARQAQLLCRHTHTEVARRKGIGVAEPAHCDHLRSPRTDPGQPEQLFTGAVPVTSCVEHHRAVRQRTDQRDQRPLPGLRKGKVCRIDLGEILDRRKHMAESTVGVGNGPAVGRDDAAGVGTGGLERHLLAEHHPQRQFLLVDSARYPLPWCLATSALRSGWIRARRRRPRGPRRGRAGAGIGQSPRRDRGSRPTRSGTAHDQVVVQD